MKILCIGDIHLGKNERHDIRIDDVMSWVEDNDWFSADRIVFLGDIFDQGNKVNTKSLLLADKIFSKLSNHHAVVLHGNHDLFERQSFNNTPLTLYTKHNVQIIDTIIKDDEEPSILYVPWILNQDMMDELIKQADDKIIFGHFEFAGFRLTPTYESTGYSPSLLSKARRIISGHYHNPQSKGNIDYIGVPVATDWNCANQTELGVAIYDTDTDTITRHPYTRRKYWYIQGTLEEVQQYDITDDCDVKVIATEEQIQDIEEKYPNSQIIINQPTITDLDTDHMTDVSCNDLTTVIHDFVSNISVDGIDNKILMDLLEETE